MEITTADILKDIEGFQSRIAKAKAEIAVLSEGYLPYPEHEHREKQRREYESECSHCLKLIEYAREGIAIRQTDK